MGAVTGRPGNTFAKLLLTVFPQSWKVRESHGHGKMCGHGKSKKYQKLQKSKNFTLICVKDIVTEIW